MFIIMGKLRRKFVYELVCIGNTVFGLIWDGSVAENASEMTHKSRFAARRVQFAERTVRDKTWNF